MIGFLVGSALGIGLTLIITGCFALNERKIAYSAGYSNGFIAGADVTAENEIAKGVCA